jgi:hypothetical protein
MSIARTATFASAVLGSIDNLSRRPYVYYHESLPSLDRNDLRTCGDRSRLARDRRRFRCREEPVGAFHHRGGGRSLYLGFSIVEIVAVLMGRADECTNRLERSESNDSAKSKVFLLTSKATGRPALK